MPKFIYCPQCAKQLVERTIEDQTRAACPDLECGFVHYDNPTPVVAAIVQKGDDVILVRNIGWPETWFGIVSGFLERGETPEDGVLREVREEIQVDAQLVGLVGVYPFERFNQVIMVYHVTIDDEPVANEAELAAIKHVPIQKLKPWHFGTGPAVADWLQAQLG